MPLQAFINAFAFNKKSEYNVAPKENNSYSFNFCF